MRPYTGFGLSPEFGCTTGWVGAHNCARIVKYKGRKCGLCCFITATATLGLKRFYRSCTRLWHTALTHTALTHTAAGGCFADNHAARGQALKVEMSIMGTD